MLSLRKVLKTPVRKSGDAGRHGDDVAGSPAAIAPARSQAAAEAGSQTAAGQYGAALTLIDRALAATPDAPEFLFARASTLYAWGRLREARDSGLRAEALGLRSAGLQAILEFSAAVARMERT